MRRCRLLLMLFVSAVLICSVGTQAHAQTRASDYVAWYSVSSYQGEKRGQIDIECNIRAKWAVPKIGVLKIEIYQANGDHVTTIQGSTSNGLLSPKSSLAHIVTYTYNGVPGTTYYAKVTLCAGSNSDYDTRNVQTQKVTAPY
ncbi:hypothetical protein B5F22_01985 [Pseudoflavonifractor sp. An187]|nr:hypothetical protein B5F22_01985 [Pseudoflavonifractor sp. An187]